jgi:hypothetical protein
MIARGLTGDRVVSVETEKSRGRRRAFFHPARSAGWGTSPIPRVRRPVKQGETQMHADKQGCTRSPAEPTLAHVRPSGRASAPFACIPAYLRASAFPLPVASTRADPPWKHPPDAHEKRSRLHPEEVGRCFARRTRCNRLAAIPFTIKLLQNRETAPEPARRPLRRSIRVHPWFHHLFQRPQICAHGDRPWAMSWFTRLP